MLTATPTISIPWRLLRAVAALALILLCTSATSARATGSTPSSIGPYLDRPGGQTVVVPGGTYTGATTRVRRDQPLILVAESPVIINGTVKFGGASNVVLRGEFVINGGVHIRSSDNITLDRVEITNRNVGTVAPTSVGVLINVDFNDNRPSRNVSVINSYIHDTYDDAFRVGLSENVLIQGNLTERIFDVPRNTCANNTKCHDDGLQVMQARGLRVLDNDFAANLMIVSDAGPIEITAFAGNRIHDDHHFGVNFVQRDARRPVTVNVTGPNWSWNHPNGPFRFTGGPTVTNQELLVGGQPPSCESVCLVG